jgi:outer membrane protein OmpA-like peptidoglycan-associated protein
LTNNSNQNSVEGPRATILQSVKFVEIISSRIKVLCRAFKAHPIFSGSILLFLLTISIGGMWISYRSEIVSIKGLVLSGLACVWTIVLGNILDNSRHSEPQINKRLEKFARFFWNLLGDSMTIIVLLVALTYGWNFMRHRLMADPQISFASTTFDYNVNLNKMQTIEQSHANPVESTRRITSITLTLLFPDGEFELDRFQKKEIRDFGNVGRLCEGSRFTIDGFASSRKFKGNSDLRNKDLANERSRFVKDQLVNSQVLESAIISKIWDTYPNMRGSSLIQDDIPPAEARRAFETLNRRVVVVLELGRSCHSIQEVQ